MNTTAYTKKLVISSIALSLMLGGSSLYAAKQSYAAAASKVQTQQQASEHLQDPGNALHKQRRANDEDRKSSHGFPILDEAASILGMDKQALEDSLKQGKSIVDVAKEKGISEADITAKLLKLRNDKIDSAVKSGKLDADKAKSIKQRMPAHLKFLLNDKGLPNRHEQGSRGERFGFHPSSEELAQFLGISKDQLISELKAGKSLTEIAAAKGISKQQLLDKIKELMTPSIERMADHKKAAAAN
ncbi:hypothetical protein [Paenibacillus eucommiae]|uniref:DNA-directed RNA polymerase specialized sigma subunit n=1 Tax=Paenibacillus eucommiae TaxID=1355755 RepID=A0ABS4JB92_9BACL|nr:hypothetical protein [Paenibacillus eucommiae]MBP1996511.1 DNA-directed RNA polymerase specialized sigma subunit [Paenibacillus eucommiae]